MKWASTRCGFVARALFFTFVCFVCKGTCTLPPLFASCAWRLWYAQSHPGCWAAHVAGGKVQTKLPPYLQVFLSHWGSDTAQETEGAAPCPNSLLYTSWVTATVHERAFYEGGFY